MESCSYGVVVTEHFPLASACHTSLHTGACDGGKHEKFISRYYTSRPLYLPSTAPLPPPPSLTLTTPASQPQAPMMQGPVMPGPMMPSSFPPYMPPGAVPGPNYPRPMMGPQMGMGVAGPWMSMPTQPGLPQHNYPSEEQIGACVDVPMYICVCTYIYIIYSHIYIHIYVYVPDLYRSFCSPQCVRLLVHTCLCHRRFPCWRYGGVIAYRPFSPRPCTQHK